MASKYFFYLCLNEWMGIWILANHIGKCVYVCARTYTCVHAYTYVSVYVDTAKCVSLKYIPFKVNCQFLKEKNKGWFKINFIC